MKTAADDSPPVAVLVWENFGPMHDDRCRQCNKYYAEHGGALGIEIVGASSTYAWETETPTDFRKITLFPNQAIESIGVLKRASKLVRACLHSRSRHIFLCHYEHPATLLSAIALRLFGRRVYVMSDSKFDDYKRFLGKEIVKSLFYLPYCGGLASGIRSIDYLRFLGIRAERIRGVYNAVSLERIRRLANAPPAPAGVAFGARHFTIVARFVPKKNLPMAIDAYALYFRSVASPRPLHICGSGALEQALREKVETIGLTDWIIFLGFIQAQKVCETLASTLALILPSTEEQFGNVVLEAQAMGVPVLVSLACGARDQIVRSGVNGFVFEPDNPAGVAFFMRTLSEDEHLWTRMCLQAPKFAANGDVRLFSDAVQDLVSLRDARRAN